MKKMMPFVLFLLIGIQALPQENQLPRVDLKTFDGQVFNTSDIEADGNPLILSFWASWCKPCIKELSAYDAHYVDWNAETGVEVIAVSVDNARSKSRVAPFVNGRGWTDFRFYLDPNQDFKRAMNVVNVPHTMLLNGNNKVVWEHTSYSEGDEYELYDKLLEITQK